ncbi:MAG: hypothetical protein JSW04_08155 [Desulfobacterales bacterium]|nr:MAG: hypothetical protein JSW04_08155 [Desulfobacterales bacterium]
MNRWKGKTIITFSTLAFLLVLGCASTQVEPGAVAEMWKGKITGMIDGDIKFSIVRIAGENNSFSVKGNMDMKGQRIVGYGEGEIKCTIKGKIKNEVMNAIIHGRAVVSDGSADVSGTLVGTMSKTQAFGTWNLSHVGGIHSGEWTAEKTSTSQ